MTATSSLEDYIKQFKQDYKKYLSSDGSSVSSIDTDELLSDISSEASSQNSRPLPKGSIKSISSLKKRSKKAKVNPPSYMKPLHSTPLKMIQEEEEFADSKNKLSEYMPSKQFDISEYLPRARAAKNQKVNEIIASLDLESESMSIISSVDTEALLHSSDEEEDKIRNNKNLIKKLGKEKKSRDNDTFSIISSVDTEALLQSSDEEEKEELIKERIPKTPVFNSQKEYSYADNASIISSVDTELLLNSSDEEEPQPDVKKTMKNVIKEENKRSQAEINDKATQVSELIKELNELRQEGRSMLSKYTKKFEYFEKSFDNLLRINLDFQEKIREITLKESGFYFER